MCKVVTQTFFRRSPLISFVVSYFSNLSEMIFLLTSSAILLPLKKVMIVLTEKSTNNQLSMPLDLLEV
jgi:hypothetical protein